MTTALRQPPILALSPNSWSRGVRRAVAGCFVLAGVLWVAAELIGFGKNDIDGLNFMASDPTLAGIGLACDMLAVPFLFGAVLAWYVMSRGRSPRLALIGAVMLVFGLTGQSLVNGAEATQYQIMNSGKITASTLDSAVGSGPAASVPGLTMMVMFFLGAFVGIVILMIAVWRSRALPRTAVALVIAFQVAAFAPIPFPTTVLAAAGLIWMAASVVRTNPAQSSAADASPVPVPAA